MDGTTRPCATLTAQHATAMLDQLQADREQSRYWQHRWATDHGDNHIDAWLTSLADWLPDTPAHIPLGELHDQPEHWIPKTQERATDHRPVASVVARDDDRVAWLTEQLAIAQSAVAEYTANGRFIKPQVSAGWWDAIVRLAVAWPEWEPFYSRDERGPSDPVMVEFLASLRVEVERAELDMAVAVREANHHRGLVAKVAALHVAEPTDPFWCQACQTSSWPCPTATALSVPVPS